MPQPLSIENENHVSLITTRTSGSRLWLLHNPRLEELILGSLARYQDRYKVEIYAFVLMGNHYHLIARFPQKNRALFMRDFNSAVGRLVGRYVSQHGRRAVWARRYAHQVLADPEDIYHWFFYVALNPVSSGIVSRISQYPCYNSFNDASLGLTKKFKWINWSDYTNKKRFCSNISEESFTTYYTLTYSVLPTLAGLTPKAYRETLRNELYERERQIHDSRKSNGQGFLGVENYWKQKLGSIPLKSKISHRYSFRPLVLSLCKQSKDTFLNAYFAIKNIFADASYRFRKGKMVVLFPSGTYPPPRLFVA